MIAYRDKISAVCKLFVAEIKAVLCSLHSLALDVRRNRAFIEKEIHHDEFKIRSKNDDDLPALQKQFHTR